MTRRQFVLSQKVNTAPPVYSRLVSRRILLSQIVSLDYTTAVRGVDNSKSAPISEGPTQRDAMKISVIMVCFNSEATIRFAVDSFLAQDHTDRELIVVDGASRDRTVEIVRNYQSPLITLTSEPDLGLYDAMNKGLRRFTGDAFGFLNSDDRYHDPQALSRIAAGLANADLVTGDLDFVRTHDGFSPVRVWKAGRYRPGAFRRGWSVPHPTTYARRAVFEKVGEFDLSFPLAADYDWLLRALEIEGFRHSIITSTLVNMMVGGKSTAGVRAVLQNTYEKLKVRQSRLEAGFADAAIIYNAVMKLKQLSVRAR